MIPIIAEKKWLNFLKDLPLWTPPRSKTIILSPHPDDETLGAGGLIVDLIKNKVEVLVIAVTDGEKAYENTKGLRQIRQKEQEKALENLGVPKKNIIRLKLKDSSVQLAEAQLEKEILPFLDKNTNLIAPWLKDFHPDHEAAGRVAQKIASYLEINLMFYFFWTWHHSTIASLSPLPLSIYPLSVETLNLKKMAMTCYNSQQNYAKGPSILTEKLLKPVERHFEVFLKYKK